MESTKRPYSLRNAPTRQAYAASAQTECLQNLGDNIGGWKPTRLIEKNDYRVLCLAENEQFGMGVLKLYTSLDHISPVMRKLRQIHDKRLLSILDMGIHDGHVYEVSQYLPAGTLEGKKLSEDVILNVVIPQLTRALKVLHHNQLLHNDIKPANIFWSRENSEILLGDFDTVSEANKDRFNEFAIVGTEQYMAPEVLSGGWKNATVKSDICSMGVTLIALLTGESPLKGNAAQIRRGWQRGPLLPGNLSTRMNVLLSNLVKFEPRQRYDTDQIEVWMRQNKVSCDSEDFVMRQLPNPTSSHLVKKPLIIRDTYIISIEQLIEWAGSEWEEASQAHQQSNFDIFLRQFGVEYYDLCIRSRRDYFADKDIALFYLLCNLNRKPDFFWCGEHFENHADFASKMLDRENEVDRSRSARFLMFDLLGIYLQSLPAAVTNEQLNFAKSLANVARKDPELALTQLFTSLSAKPEFCWHGEAFSSLEMLAQHIVVHTENDLDQMVNELIQSRRFEAWLAFVGHADLRNEIDTNIRRVAM